nr:MAG TPA: hypothetical protein [Bacteriophage sp.]
MCKMGCCTNNVMISWYALCKLYSFFIGRKIQ